MSNTRPGERVDENEKKERKGIEKQGVCKTKDGGNSLVDDTEIICLHVLGYEVHRRGGERTGVQEWKEREKKGAKHGEVRDMGINLHGVTERTGSARPTESLSPNWSTF